MPDPLLRYENMPKAAQELPDASSLGCDAGVPLEVLQCPACGLVQLGNDPVPYYKSVIRAAAYSGEMKTFRLRQFGNFLDRWSLHGKKVLEIGCGRGEYLSLMSQAGADAYGLEHAEESVAHCVRAGLKVSRGFVERTGDRLPHAPFHAFYMLNFLEHLPDPNATLRGIGKNLTDDAVGLVEVPNFDMIIRKELFSEFISDHLFYFTRETFETALRLNGFEVVECAEVWHDYILSAVVKKRLKTDLSLFVRRQATLKRELETFIDRYPLHKTAIWGAGHQALAVMALAGLAGKIRYVVDSAPFKQGKYTPATHIPIVAPQSLATDPVDAVIVMAASYSDEVVSLIRQRFGRAITVAVLRDAGLNII